jgi:thiol-disulfide isomerase/thioredoxin
MKFKILYIFLIFSLIFSTGCEKKDEINDSIVADVKDEVSVPKELILKTTNNKNITITIEDGKLKVKEYKDKIILLNFWATWCPPCKAEIPHLINLQNKYEKDFIVLAITVEKDKSNEALNQFIQEYQINYPVTNSIENFDLASMVGGVSSIPAMFLFDKTGLMVQNYVGAVQEEILDSDIKKHLGK